MVRNLGVRISTFSGAVNHVRCFDHVVSLSAKSVLSLFDVAKEGKEDASLDNAEKALRELADGLELEEAMHRIIAPDDSMGEEDDDTDIGNPMEEVTHSMSPEELDELRSSTIPVQTVLVKVRTEFLSCSCSRLTILPLMNSFARYRLPSSTPQPSCCLHGARL